VCWYTKITKKKGRAIPVLRPEGEGDANELHVLCLRVQHLPLHLSDVNIFFFINFKPLKD
jgi:hypothetical protein